MENRRDGARKNNGKMFPPSSTNLWMNNSISGALVPSPRHNDACIGQPHLRPFPHLRHQGRAKVARDSNSYTSNNVPDMNYRLTLNIVLPPSAPLSFFHPISSSKLGEMSVDSTISRVPTRSFFSVDHRQFLFHIVDTK